MIDYKEKLNPQQYKAVTTTEGPLLVLAGAGSGKTRTLTYRVAYLIDKKGINPKNILAVTFTNKAANEMKERVMDLVEEGRVQMKGKLNIGTFHSICLRMLRKHASKIGYESDFLIYDAKDQKAQIKEIMNNLEVDRDQFNPNSIRQNISNAKNKMMRPDEYSAQAGSFYEEVVAQIYQAYQRKLKNRNVMDFDDLLFFTVELLQDNPKVLKQYQDKFKYILIDEYQDTNHVQYLFSKLLAGKHKNICVVGDDAQSIFGWRGADYGNILNFQEDWPDAQVIKLEQNYRSTENIIKAAQGIIEQADEIFKKELWTENEEGSKVKVQEAIDERHEARYVVQKIEEAVDKGYSLSDIVILFRVNAQSRIMEEALMKAGIPYKVVGTVKFYARKEIKDILSYLRVLVNPKDRISFERIVNTPRRGIGKKTFSLIRRFQEELLEDFKINEQLESDLNSSQLSSVKGFVDLIKELRRVSQNATPAEVIDEVMEISGYREMLKDDTEKGEERLENIEELKTLAEDFSEPGLDSLRRLLEQVSLFSGADEIETEKDLVNLMTIHAAKGLEFKVVFVIGMEEGLLPYYKSLADDKELAEEQRLCYVALTRAQEELLLVYARRRQMYGKVQSNPPSRFLMQISEDLLDINSF